MTGGNGWRLSASLLAVVEDADAEPLGLVGEIVGDAGARENDDGLRAPRREARRCA